MRFLSFFFLSLYRKEKLLPNRVRMGEQNAVPMYL